MPRLVRWISGTLVGSISFWKADSVYMRYALPGPVRPARPARCRALAWLMGATTRLSIPICGGRGRHQHRRGYRAKAECMCARSIYRGICEATASQGAACAESSAATGRSARGFLLVFC